MNSLRLYLWKEWREHRFALLGAALTCVALVAGAWPLVPPHALRDPYPSLALVFALGIVLLAVGGELLSERRPGGMAWLDRLPAGLAVPFWTKLVFHATTLVAAGFLGIGLAFGLAWLRGETQGFVVPGPTLIFLAVLFGLWTFAASSWSSRSVLALFSAAFVLAGLGLPIWYLGLQGYQIRLWEVLAGAALLFVGWLPSAWLGFVTAGRFGRGPGRSGLLGFSAAVACFLPFWGWSAWQIHLRDRFDPQREGFEICSAVVTEDERTAFVEAWMWSERWDADALPRSVLRVNLEDGSSQLIRRGDVTMIPTRMCSEDCQKADNIVVHVRQTSEPEVGFYLASGAPMGTQDVVRLPFRCPERRGWLMTSAPFRAESTLTDQCTGKVLHPAELSLPSDAWLWSDLGNWFVISPRQGAFLLDPDSNVLERAEWLDSVSERFGPRLADGRFFAPLRAGGVGLVDPRRAQVTQVVGGERVERVYRCHGYGNQPFEEGEAVLLRTSEGEYRFQPAPERLEPVPFLHDPHIPIGSARDGTVFVTVGNGLVRYDIDSGKETRLFPRSH